MKRLTSLLLLMSAAYLSSCMSEYEERLSQGLVLKDKLLVIEETAELSGSGQFSQEIKEIREEITLLARISGNEDLFLQQVYGQFSSSSWFGSQK